MNSNNFTHEMAVVFVSKTLWTFDTLSADLLNNTVSPTWSSAQRTNFTSGGPSGYNPLTPSSAPISAVDAFPPPTHTLSGSPQVDLFSKQLLLVPVHLEVHWSLVAVDPGNRSIRLYDSELTALPEVTLVKSSTDPIHTPSPPDP